MNTMTIKPSDSVTVTVPPGKYFLGDPCYAVPDDYWDDLLDSCDFFNTTPVGVVNGNQVLSFNTAYGDGTYEDQYGNEYPVDAGMIGLTPAAFVDGDPVKARLGQWVEFNCPTICYSADGVLTFGKFNINTDI